jgi:hypothetical protein
MHWGDEHFAGDGGPPLQLRHRDCGGAIDDRRTCERCGRTLAVGDVTAVAGPGADEAVRDRLSAV